MRGSTIALALLALALTGQACIYKYGTSPDSLSHPKGTVWDYKTLGDDWEGDDGNGNKWVCLSGKAQSPINIPMQAVSGDVSLRTTWHYPPLTSNGTNLQVINNGHALQVEWAGQNFTGHMNITVSDAPDAIIYDILAKPNALEGTRQVIGKPAQFHFHTGEHLLFGHEHPVEMHVVSFVDKAQMPNCTYHPNGCIAVTGIFFDIRDDEDNPALQTILDNIPYQEGGINHVPKGGVIDIEALLPPPDKRTYFQYRGSLTAPPCLEGLLWHVFDTPVYMSMAQFRKFLNVFNDKACESKGNQTDLTLKPRVPYSSDAAHSRKMLHSHDHAHHHAHSHASVKSAIASMPRMVEIPAALLPTIRRDAEGRLLMTSPRRSLSEGSGDMVCVVYAYARNNRQPQPVHDRLIKWFAMPTEGHKMYNCSRSVGGMLMMPKGDKIDHETIKADGWEREEHAHNQAVCKRHCDKKKACEGIIYKKDRSCTLLSMVSEWVPASSGVYDACHVMPKMDM